MSDLIKEALECLLRISEESRKIPLPDSDLEATLESAHTTIRDLVEQLKLTGEVVEAAIDVSLTQDGIFELKSGVMNSRESALEGLNKALLKLKEGK